MKKTPCAHGAFLVAAVHPRQRQNSANKMMIGSGMPSSQSSAPLPKPMGLSSACSISKRQQEGEVPNPEIDARISAARSPALGDKSPSAIGGTMRCLRTRYGRAGEGILSMAAGRERAYRSNVSQPGGAFPWTTCFVWGSTSQAAITPSRRMCLGPL